MSTGSPSLLKSNGVTKNGQIVNLVAKKDPVGGWMADLVIIYPFVCSESEH